MNKPDLSNEPSVFILGAGASKPYGFPLGTELKSQILNVNRGSIQKYFQSLNSQELEKLIGDFRAALKYGDYKTIDYFLERKKRFRELGSYYIATAIAKLENHGNLFPQRDFYADIYSILNLESESDKASPLSIVTLNYDRSIEEFLTHNIKYNCHGDIEDHAQDKLSKVPIIHAHGSLGDISTAPYGKIHNTNSPKLIQEAANRIKIISDKLEGSNEFYQAQNTIAQAKNIFFFGFGYHERTLNTLLAKANLKEKCLFGTAMGLDEENLKKVTVFFNSNNSNISFGNPLTGSSAYIKQFMNAPHIT